MVTDASFNVKVQGKLVSDVLNSQNIVIGANYRINTKILSTTSPLTYYSQTICKTRDSFIN